MKQHVRNALLLLGVIALVMTVATALARPTEATPSLELHGPNPIYDSGWVWCGTGIQTFEHNLYAIPTHIEMYAADNSDGDDPSKVMDVIVDGDNNYGGNVRDVTHTILKVYWQPDGIAYNHEADKWYLRGVDYVRILVFSADDLFGNMPYRP